MRVNQFTSNTTVEDDYIPGHGGVNVELIILMIMLSVFSVVGSIGNGMVIFVFQRVRDKSTAQVFIISMAVIDLFTCMVIIPLTMFVEYTEYAIKYDFLCKLYHFLITSQIPMSAFIMVAIAFDRYFCICHPLRKIITHTRARGIVICLAFLACFFGVFTSLFFGVYQVYEHVDIEKIDDAAGTNFSKYIRSVDEIITLEGKSTLHQEERAHMAEVLGTKAIKFNGTVENGIPVKLAMVYVGECNPTRVNLGKTLFHVYQKSYMAVYPVCLITVMILYFMIYRFLCHRRSKKLQQKLIMCSYVNGDGTYENTRLVSGEVEDTRRNSKNKVVSPEETPDHSPRTVSEVNMFSSRDVHGFSSTTITGLSMTSKCQQDSDDTRKTINKATHDYEKHDNHYLDNVSRNKISSSPTILSNIITPSDNDDSTPILSFSNSTNHSFRLSTTDRSQLMSGRRHSRLQEQKYHWHKNRDSVKRYKDKTKRGRYYSNDADKLREENRSANVKTALMLFTVTIVFMVAFVPAWAMAHRLLDHIVPVFYLYFIYNVANPFIYAFMNHIFKDYMRKVFSCRQLTFSHRRAS